MAKHYEVVRDATGLDKGQVLTDSEIEKNHARHGGVENMLRKGTIVQTTKKAADVTDESERADNASGTSKIDRQDYDQLSVKELRDMAKDKGITDFAKLGKEDLIAELKKAN